MKIFLRDMKIFKEDLLRTVKMSLTIVIPTTAFLFIMREDINDNNLLPIDFYIAAVIFFGISPLIGFMYLYFTKLRKLAGTWMKEFDAEDRSKDLYKSFMKKANQ